MINVLHLNTIFMKNNILITMAILILVGLAVQGMLGVAAGILVSAIIGIIYGAAKKDKQFIRWSVTALVIDLICVLLIYVGMGNL